MIFCPNCNAPNPDSVKFCGRCGKPLREEKPAEEEKVEQVPSWLKDLGGALESGLEPGPAPVLQGGAEAAPPAPEGLPPWLAEETPPAPAPAAETGLPPWLAEEAPPKAAPATTPAAEELPPWLAGETPPEAAPVEAPAEGLPPWLAAEEAPVAPPAPEAVPGEGLPAWLAVEEAPLAPPAPEVAPVEGLPAWLAEEGKAAPEEAPAEGLPPWLAVEEAPVAPPALEAAPGEELPAWLAEEGKAAPEEAPAEGLPPWLAVEEAPLAPPAPEAVPGEGLPPWLAVEEAPVAPPAPAAVPGEGLPAWLAEEGKAAPEEAPAEGLPPWLAAEEAPVAPPAPEAAPGEGLPAWLAVEEAPVAPPAPEAVPGEGLPAWLAEEGKAAPEEAPAEGLPPWLAVEEAPVAPPAPEAAPGEGLPAWLAEEGKAAPEEAPAEGLPAWLAVEEVPAEAVPEVPPAGEIPTMAVPSEEVPAGAAGPESKESPEWLGGLEESLPSWLAAEGQAAVPEEEAGLPSWLTGEVPVAGAPAEVGLEEETTLGLGEEVPAAGAPLEAGLPSWLEEEAPAEGGPKEEAPPWLAAEVAAAGAPAEAGLPSWLEEEAPAEGGPKEEAPPWLAAEVAAAGAPAEAGPKEEAPVGLAEEALAAAVSAEAAGPAVPLEELLGEEVPAESVAAPVLWSELGEVPPLPPAVEEGRAIPVAPEEEAGLPEWARALRPVEETPPAPREGESFLAGVELPEWLRAEERPAAVERPAGDMDWLDRLVKEEAPEEVPSVAAIERLPRPALPLLSPARQRAAEVFAGLLASPEPAVKAKPQPVSTALQRVLRWLAQRWPMLALALLMIVMTTVNLPLPEAPLPNTPGVREAFAAISKVAPQPGQAPAVVLVAYDWDVQRSAEMRPLAMALTAHLMKLQTRIIAVSTTFQGNQLAQEVKDEALRELKKDPDFVDDGYYADDKYGGGFLNLSMRTGGESALRLLGSQPISQTFPADFVYGRASGQYPLVQQVGSLDEVALLIVMAGEEDRVVAWMEQVCARQPSPRPCVLVVPTELSPLVEPYNQARGISPAGVLWGLPAAVEYEAQLEVLQGISVNREVSLQQRLHLLTVAEIGLVVLIVLGNLVQIGAWLGGLRKGSSRA